MKILIIGGRGTIGRKVAERLSEKHEVIIAARNSGDFFVDIAKPESIRQVLEQIPSLDSIVCTAGEAKWDDFKDLSEADFYLGIKSKMMGQINLVRIAQDFLKSRGSITLTTGILADDPVVKTTSAAMVNGAIHSFVKAVALEIENEIRINAVSCGVVQDAYEKYKDFFPGYDPIPMDRVVNAYLKSVEGKINGQVVKVYS